MIGVLVTRPDAAYFILGFCVFGILACLTWLWWLWWTVAECWTCHKPNRHCRCHKDSLEP